MNDRIKEEQVFIVKEEPIQSEQTKFLEINTESNKQNKKPEQENK